MELLILFFINVILLLWFRSESESDGRRLLKKINDIQVDIRQLHGRLSRIEEKNKGD